jgi:D-erythronate 2-dehydrogenase
VEIEDAAFSKAAEEGFSNEGGIDAGEFGEAEGLGYGVDCLGDDELIGELGHLPAADGAEVGDVFAHGLKDGKRTLEIRLAAASHDGECGRFCSDLTAGDGGVDPVHALCPLFGFGDAGGTEVDDECVFVQALNEAARAEDDAFDDIGHGEIDADDARADFTSEFGKCGSAAHPQGHSGLCGGGAAIPNDDDGSGFMEMTCIGAAHVAESDESDLVSCERLAHVTVNSHQAVPDGKLLPNLDMKIIITGGGGFLGSQLAQKLLERGSWCGQPITEIVLLDAFFRSEPTDARVKHVKGDIGDRATVFAATGSKFDVIFHLASMVSGECEERFDDAMRVNLEGGRNVFEAARAAEGRPRVVFASSVAVYGGLDMSQMMSDLTKQLPQTTYGMTKAICEMMVNDHTRKGHFDGRSVRLPTVIVRPGKPNAAASSWASGMFREPLNGETCMLPIRRDQPHPMTGYRTVIESFITLSEVPEEKLGKDRAYVLPAHRVTPNIAEKVIQEVAAEKGITLGPVVDAFDARIQGIVDNWPQQVDGARAEAIGLPKPPELKVIVKEYLADFGMK